MEERQCETGAISVLLADDHELVRLGVRALIQAERDMEFVGEAANFTDTLDMVRRSRPDVVLLDLILDDGDILERIPELLTFDCTPRVLILTADPDPERHCNAFRHGAVGIVTKKQPAQVLLKAIRQIHAGELWIDRHTTAALFHDYRRAANPPSADAVAGGLTPRERRIAQLAAQGIPVKKIAVELNVSEKTVRNQLVAIYGKLGVSGQLELAANAVKLGLIQL